MGFSNLKTLSVKKCSLFLLLLALWMIATPLATVFAEPFSHDDLKDLNYYPHWVEDVCDTQATDAPTPGEGAPDGAQFPKLDPAKMASSIDAFIKKNNPSSKLSDLGATIVASAKQANVSPFLIVSIAYKESSLASPSDYNVSHGSNSFGRTATSSQPHFQGNMTWYKWSSVKASVDFTAPENKKASGGGDMAAYLRNQYGDALDSSDLVSLFMKYAPPADNNTSLYIKQVKSWVDDMVKGAGSSSDASSNASDTSKCCPTANQSVTVDGKNAPTNLVGKDNVEKAYNFFLQVGLSPAQSAGVVANLYNESSVNPKTGGSPSASAFGIAQWTPGSKFSTDKRFNKISGSDTDLLTQLLVLWAEMNGKSSPSAGFTTNIVPKLKKITDPGEAADFFRANFERCDTSYSSCSQRAAVGKQMFRRLAHGSNTGGEVNSSSSSSSEDCESSGAGSDGTAFVLDGYAWPVDIKKSELDSGYPWPCPGNCHHDNTPAFDLSTKKAVQGNDKDVVGRSEFAIIDGTVENMHIYDGIAGCYSLQLKGKDGYYYYYTHFRNPAVKNGAKVKAGDKVAEVGERKCTGNGSYPHLHIDRGSPKGSFGGTVGGRDSKFVPLINKLYEKLP